jgi:hypothetical protein
MKATTSDSKIACNAVLAIAGALLIGWVVSLVVPGGRDEPQLPATVTDTNYPRWLGTPTQTVGPGLWIRLDWRKTGSNWSWVAVDAVTNGAVGPVSQILSQIVRKP